MILTVTLNFALDVTYHVPAVRLGETARVSEIDRRAGGKGVNVARVLHGLGRDVAVTGLAGGTNGAAARRELAAAGLRDETVDIDGESRLNVMVVDHEGRATGFAERGPEIRAGEWAALLERYRALLPGAGAAVVSGSVPPGVPADGCAALVAAAREAGRPVLLDADGEQLMRALTARPSVVKINREELRGVVSGDDVAHAAASLRELGAEAVVISLGAQGMLALAERRVLLASPPRALRGNPTGAGDAASAALAIALIDGRSWDEALADAAALSAAAVAAPHAGEFDARLYRELRAEIRASELRVPQ